ncbi:tryptophan--tRNA ligase [Cellulomonas sp. zg-ZUI199]|uniref:Tryptophan--tRNA ligase n=1 Tax=Cellulomonas wangleii TaxID=2816956 RepID=A0ABX8D4B7_9CELL|nr:tryptophan--tRNA ligase [Cellulomonas wangleii]MBO0923365.1 tryptophan--tRNA ligase [Cellulomonas wangleii]QVI61720.1 tryptophan--tRNA ligase [Cellulomonas wangleii]
MPTTARSAPSAAPSPAPAAGTRSGPDHADHARPDVLTLEEVLARDPGTFRVLTGDRPTGALHVGHLFGTLATRVALQRHGVETFVVVADYQVITDRDDAGDLPATVREVVLDYLAAGLDPEATTVFVHSDVPAVHQLMLPFLSLVTVAELDRNPTVKAELAASGRALSALLLTYPVHQAADILSVRGTLVPVGRDQLPHLELTRTVARRFTRRYGPVLTEPTALLSQAPLVLGTDGAKMSKSRGNAIELRADADATAAAVRGARTDARRTITYDPAHRPEVSNLLLLGALASARTPQDLADEIADGGAAALKAYVTDALVAHLAPVRARRAELARDPFLVRDVLARGAARAAQEADATLADVRRAMRQTS